MPTIACLNFGDGLHLYHAGFRAGAEALIESLEREHHGQDLLVYPLVYCLRHAAEVALKMVIRGARNLLDEPGGFPDGHQLHHLWDTARPLLRQIFGDDQESFKRVATMIESLRALDPECEAFRYPVSTKRSALAGRRQPTLDPTIRHLDLRRLYDDVCDVLDLLDGADSAIDVYAEYKAEHRRHQEEMAAEAHAEYRQYENEVRAEMAAEYAEYSRNEC